MAKLGFVMYLEDDFTEIVDVDLIHNFNCKKEDFILKYSSSPPKVKVDWWDEKTKEMLTLDALLYFVGGK